MKFFLYTIAIIGFISCKPSKEVSTENAPESSISSESSSTDNATNISNTQQPVKATLPQSLEDVKKSLPDTIRLAISLISIGEGTDPEGLNILTSCLETFSTKTGKKPAYSIIPWGREGEVEYYFNLNELSQREKQEFISNLNSAFKGHKLVLITENMKNRFRR